MSSDADPPPSNESSSDDPLRLAREIADSYRDSTAPLPQRPARRGRKNPRRLQRDDPEFLADVMGSFIEQQGWTERLAQTRVFTDWAAIVGPEVAAHCEVEQFDEGVAHIKASSTAWAKELKLLAPRIVARLNEELGDGSVLRLQIRGPQGPNWSKGPRRVKGRGPRDTFG